MDRTPDTRAGNQTLTLEFEGRDVGLLDGEAGGHRVQRVPRSEKQGRVHSSTVTVAVLGEADGRTASPWTRRSEGDFSVTFYSGSGAGGQHRNKHMNSARITHLPTGTVRTSQTRSRENSQQLAMAALLRELDGQAGLAGEAAVNGKRRGQVGTGERSDKRRTWRFQEGRVHDHATGLSAECSRVMAGGFRALWS